MRNDFYDSMVRVIGLALMLLCIKVAFEILGKI